MNNSQRGAKRAIDIAVSGIVLLGSAPVLLPAMLAVRFVLGSPVLFRQARPGLNGELFELVKLRTMTDGRDANGELLPDEQRIHWFGDLLRKSSVDELPSLLNILRGEMSLVGPRPLLPRYLERYSPEQARRHDVKPGLTGLAQVSGRNLLGWNTRMKLDVEYVDTQSLKLDMVILAKTVRSVLNRTGIYAADGRVPREFGMDDASAGG